MNLPAAGGEVSVKTQISEDSSCAFRKKWKNCLPDSFAAKAKPNEAERETKPSYNVSSAIKTAAIAAMPSVAMTNVSACNDAAGWCNDGFLFSSLCMGIFLA